MNWIRKAEIIDMSSLINVSLFKTGIKNRYNPTAYENEALQVFRSRLSLDFCRQTNTHMNPATYMHVSNIK